MAVLLEMPVRIVQSKQNARLKELRRALNRFGREDGQFQGIEGPNLLEEALRAGLRLPFVFVAQEMQHLLDGVPLGADTEVLLVPRILLNAALSTETPQPVAALVQPPDWTWTHVLGRRKVPALLVVLAGIQDPGNLGTILRSAEAFGADGVVSLPGTASCWNQKAVRASAGSVFRLPVISAGMDECLMRLREAGIRLFTTMLSGGTPARDADLAAPSAILIGNEGSGVPDEIAAEAGGAITIPCPGPVESLNASVAAGVLLYEASRQRQAIVDARKAPE
ncbi:MAG TPA: RNA methyltransferase [Terracidiphilus sp.]|jgi:TrmH family RNA methyltransferase